MEADEGIVPVDLINMPKQLRGMSLVVSKSSGEHDADLATTKRKFTIRMPSILPSCGLAKKDM